MMIFRWDVCFAVTFPDWLEDLVDHLLEMKLMRERPTQVSVNHYTNHPEPYRLVVHRTSLHAWCGDLPAHSQLPTFKQPHIDGKKGQVVIVSLLSHCCLDFYRNSGRRDLSIPFTPSMVRHLPPMDEMGT